METLLAEWKRIDMLQDVLPPKDHGRTGRAGDTIPMQEWAERAKAGKG